jgi:hypothetical protein
MLHLSASPTGLYMDIRLWAVSVNLTLAMVLNIFILIFSAVKYHIYTAILFMWTDYKTIFLPIVSPICSSVLTRQWFFSS